MSFHTDAMDGINAFVAVRNSMKTNPYDEYYQWQIEQSPQYKIWKAQQEEKKKGNAPGGTGPAQTLAPPPPVTTSTINSPAAPTIPPSQPAGAIATTPQGQIQGQDPYRLNRGGAIPHYAEGTTGVQQVGEDALSPEEIAYIRRMSEEADARARPTPLGPTGPTRDIVIPQTARSALQGGYDPRPLGPATPPPPPPQPPPPLPEVAPGAEGAVPYAPIGGHSGVVETVRKLLPPTSTPPPTQAAASAQTNPVTPQPPPTSAGGAPVLPPPTVQPPVQPAAPPGSMTPSEQALVAGQGIQPRQGAGGAPATEPPPGSMPVPGRPAAIVTAPGGGGGGGGARPRLALGDQSRTERYDPTLDAADKGNVAPVFSSGAVNPVQYAKIQDAGAHYDKVLSGAVSFAEFLTRRGEDHPHSEPSRLALHAGVGATSIPVTQGIVAAWDNGGKIPPYVALTRYMMATYENLMDKGEVAAANQMAFEVTQRLNFEAAKHGTEALGYLRQGNYPAATQAVVQGHLWVPDHKEMVVNGRTMTLQDQFTGQPVTAPVVITPKALLAQALALSDGTALWNHLSQAAEQYKQTLKPVDKDPVGRSIRNRNNLLRGIRLEQQIQKGNQPKGGAGAPSVPPSMVQFRQIANGPQPAAGGNRTTIIRQGSDDDPGPDDLEEKDE